jgi:hypothetical protein
MVLLLGRLLLLLLPTRLVLRVLLLLSLQTTLRCRVQELISTLSYYQQLASYTAGPSLSTFSSSVVVVSLAVCEGKG